MHELPICFTDGTLDGVIKMPVLGYPRWLKWEGRTYANVGLNLYAPTSREFPRPMGRVRRLSIK
jgi:hypothetical protein